MNNAARRKAPEPLGDKFRFSIVYKLSFRLITRLFGIFLSLDILICLVAAAAAVVYSENLAAAAVEKAFLTGMPSRSSAEWLEISGIELRELEALPPGRKAPGIFRQLLPRATSGGVRRFELSDEGGSLLNRLDGLRYDIALDYYGVKCEVSIGLGSFFRIFARAFITLLALQLLILISRVFKDSRLVRRTLEPISELARAAQSLNRAESQFDLNDMEELAGTLEGINASRLDTRIQLSETQDELKTLAKAINGMLDRINESYRAQVRFVSDASHELRTPISVIQGYANLLDRWGKNDQKTLQESISAIKEEAANMKELVEKLLFLARGDNNTIRLQIESFRLSDLAGEVVNETQMIDCAHCFETRLSDAVVSADRALIKQALRILVDNSIKYTESGGKIVVSAEADGALARLSVQDEGIGIRPEAVPKIFDRFYRTDESRARATGGAGLGLSIAKWIVQRHGGHMEVLSREGIGTRITLVLPASAEDALADNRTAEGP